MKTINTILGAALLADLGLAHVALKPPVPDKWLTPNSSTAPAGCRLLPSDKGFPTEAEVLKEFPNAFHKMAGTEGPDYWLQPQTVEDVQKAVKFATAKNIRLNIITTGHDFLGRSDQRSGLRLDMGAFIEPTVFANDWKVGTSLKPTTAAGKKVKRTQVCMVRKDKRESYKNPLSNWHHFFFEKRDGEEINCNDIKRSNVKRQAAAAQNVKFDAQKPWDWAVKTGYKLPVNAKTVHNFNTITPVAGKQAYARITAGVYNELFFTQAAKSGLMTLGAQHGGVSVIGGWAQAGGHNPFAHKFGLQADNIVEFEVVTPDGNFVKANEASNPDLFWALRGGGGGTFGIVTAATVKVFPTFPVTVSRFFVNGTADYDKNHFKAVAHFLQKGATYRDTYGTQGYFYVYPKSFQSVLHYPAEQAAIANVKTATAKLQGEMEKLSGGAHIEPKYYEYKTYADWYAAEMGTEESEGMGNALSYWDGHYGEGPSSEQLMMNPMLAVPFKIAESQRLAKAAGSTSKVKRHGPDGDDDDHAAAGTAVTVSRTQPMGRTYLDSRLLGDKDLNSVSLDALAEVVGKVFPRITANHVRGFLYGGGEQAKDHGNAVLPAWRTSTFHYIINALPAGSRDDFTAQAFDKLFKGLGAYVNEASPNEPNWKQVFWGANYAKLETIKNKLDPNGVLWCSPCIAADKFTFDDERLCKAATYPRTGQSPATLRNDKSTKGYASLPGVPGIPDPLTPIIQGWIQNKTIPTSMPGGSYFRMALGQGGSAGGSWSLGQGTAAAADPHAGMAGMAGMDMGAVTACKRAVLYKRHGPEEEATPASPANQACQAACKRALTKRHGPDEEPTVANAAPAAVTQACVAAGAMPAADAGHSHDAAPAAPAPAAAPAASAGMAGMAGMDGHSHDAAAPAPAAPAAAAPVAAAPAAAAPKTGSSGLSGLFSGLGGSTGSSGSSGLSGLLSGLRSSTSTGAAAAPKSAATTGTSGWSSLLSQLRGGSSSTGASPFSRLGDFFNMGTVVKVQSS